MAICNLLGALNENSGTFLTFSQYTEDLTKMVSQPGSYRVIPSKFLALNINYLNHTNYTLPLYLRDYFENGCSFLREHLGNDWTPNISSNLFWRALERDNLITINDHLVEECVYVGDINIQSHNEYSNMSYSEVYCYIPSDGKKQTFEMSLVDGNNIEEYNDACLVGMNAEHGRTDLSYNYNDVNVDLTPVINSDINEFSFNTIIVLYDINYMNDDCEVVDLYKNIPMGIYFTGPINNGIMANPATKYVMNEDAYGAGTSYGLRICSRYTPSRNDESIKVVDVTADDNGYATLSQVMTEFAKTQLLIQQLLKENVEIKNRCNELYAIFKNQRVNVPYVKYINGDPYWFANGRNTGVGLHDAISITATNDEIDEYI